MSLSPDFPTDDKALEPRPTSADLPSTEVLVADARAFAASAKAERTKKAYAADWRSFIAFCETLGAAPLPASPATVALYVTALARGGKRVATIARALVTIRQAHKLAGHDSPVTAPVHEVMKGIRRELGVAPRQKTPVLPPELRAMTGQVREGLRGLRDAALLVLGFAGAFRRSELVAINVEDLSFTTEGLIVTVRRSKTDQEGAGRKIGIPYGGHPETCPVRCVKRWIEAAAITEGPLLHDVRGEKLRGRLSDRTVARVVQHHARAVGLEAGRFGGHSLRAGLATAAAKAGKPTHVIMKQTGHRSDAILRGYIRDGTLFEQNAAAGIGL